MKTLSITSHIVIAAAALSAISGCSLVGIGTTTDTITEMGVKVDRPAAWKATKIQSDEKYVDYVIDIPQKNTSASNVDGHVALNLSKPIGNEQVTMDGELGGLRKFIGNRVTDLTTIDERDMTFMGLPAKRLVLQFRNSEDKSISEKLAITLTVKDNKAYAIMIDEDTPDFDRLLPDYEKMVTSVKFN